MKGTLCFSAGYFSPRDAFSECLQYQRGVGRGFSSPEEPPGDLSRPALLHFPSFGRGALLCHSRHVSAGLPEIMSSITEIS